MTNNLDSENLKETASDFRAIGNQVAERVLILQNELGKLVRLGADPAEIEEKRDEIDLTSSRMNQCFTKAIELDTKAALEIITATDVVNAMITLRCTTAKVKIAVDKLNKIRSALSFVAALLDIGASLATLGVAGGSSFANIKTLIEKIENIAKLEQDGLTKAEKKKLLDTCL